MVYIQRKHKFLWIRGSGDWWRWTHDGMFKKPKIQKKYKVMCRKQKRRYFKNVSNKEIKEYERGI